jgi:hypothetical protein
LITIRIAVNQLGLFSRIGGFVINPTGSLTINGVTDQELVKLLDIKIRHESSIGFNPQQMHTAQTATPQPGKPVPVYNNVILTWVNANGLEAVREVLDTLLKKEATAKAAGQ